jgi:hypothetical protein
MKLVRRVTILMGICLAVAAVPVASQGAAARQRFALRFMATDVVKNVEHDVAPKGFSVGDTAWSRMSLFNRSAQLGEPAGARVGAESLVIRVTGPRSGTVRGVASLRGGSLIVRGGFKVGSPGSGLFFPIAGGTGRFAGAKGTLYINGMISPSSELHTYRLSLPG